MNGELKPFFALILFGNIENLILAAQGVAASVNPLGLAILSLIAVVLGSKTGKDRFSDASKLLDHGFANYEMYTPAIPEGAVTEVTVKNGMTDKIMTSAKTDNSVLIKKGDKEKISADVVLPNEVEAPVEKGAVIGKIIYKNSGHQIAEYPITAAENAEQINFWKIFKIIFSLSVGACPPDC